MVKKISPESRVLSGSNVTPISKGSEVKTTLDEGLPVSGLPVAVDLTEADYFPVVQKIAAGGEETRRATMKQMKALIPAGPKGEKGDDGPQGDKGDIGPQGPQGEKGDIGPEGPKGNKGDTGDVGAEGPKGDAGPQGPIGETGPKGPKGDPGDAGGFIDLPNATVLDTVTTPGGYIVNGADNWSALKYPFPVAVGNQVMMIVSTVKSGTFDNVIQTFFATNLGGRPGSQVRVSTSSGWESWSGLVDFDFLEKNFLKVPNMSQLGLNISSPTGSVPSIYSYQKPTDDGSAPDIAYAPSSNPGVVFSLPWQFKRYMQGTFGGLVLSADSGGGMYVNVDWQNPDSPPAWKKFAFEGDVPEVEIKLDPNTNNLLSNSDAGLLLDRYKAPNVGITGTYVSSSGGPDFTKDDAFSEAGGVWRVKNTLMLSRVPAKYNGAVIVNITLGKIPCDDSGIPLQYTLSTTTTSKQVSGVWRQHSVMILAINGAPKKLMDVASGVLEDYSGSVAWNVSVKYTFGDMAPSN
ncbi:Collagen triple helix repeat (20 copies) [Serratia quinivorans]|uniref:pyocin knob domain-containing protein n=1 Tax=Serratia quinivorans TaxID=137545 RepID=UPI00217C46A7|nr:hypothetical protein [Serratia quinivorans]CAI2056995.1 Collagen triple helix repeat (20 copies) [Serratia quinivorans]